MIVEIMYEARIIIIARDAKITLLFFISVLVMHLGQAKFGEYKCLSLIAQTSSDNKISGQNFGMRA